MPSQYASAPIQANFPSENLTIAAGVAIFHLASDRVVLCYHTRDGYWFLPKGRKNANEDICTTAEREGFEESGYHNRLLPIPIRHRQTDPENGPVRFVKEPVWTQLLPLSERSQYLLFWYIAETIPPVAESSIAGQYRAVQEHGSTLHDRIKEDFTWQNDRRQIYEPVRHLDTGVDDEERMYRAQLMPVDEACEKLRGTVMEDVVRRGRDAIRLRIEMETQSI